METHTYCYFQSVTGNCIIKGLLDGLPQIGHIDNINNSDINNDNRNNNDKNYNSNDNRLVILIMILVLAEL